jgi:predicted Rdx family selenoprotein
LAALITEQCPIEIQLLPGGKGEFTVWYDDDIIAKKDGTFPSIPEIVATIVQRYNANNANS